ncbi:MAG: acyl-CoA dehydrogenase family protein [Candidatus Levybacteria bacterium]|nr:acyl-CoA dehydrogenase family protein [Candidatus Levybacteria bacterium]
MARGGEFIIPNGNLPDVSTVSGLSEEQLLIQKDLGSFMKEKVLSDEAIKRIESKDLAYSIQLMRELADLGYLGVEIPERYGGSDLGKVTGTVVAENIARQGSFACTFLAHTGIATYPILLFGTEEQKQKYLPKLVSGEWMGAYALTEAGAGSDAAAIQAKAVPTEDGKYFLLSGEKIFITNGGFADVFIIFAKINGDDSLHSAFIVEKSFDGIEIGKEEHKMGIVGSSTVSVKLNDVRVSKENMLGQSGSGLKMALDVLNLGRFKLAAASLGGARACLESALVYARQRKQFGKYLIEMPVIKGKLAMMAAYVYAMESAIYRTAGLLESALKEVNTNDQKAVLKAIGEFAIECSAIKVFCSDVLDMIIADETVQIHGGYGYIIEDKAICAAKYLLNARINRLFEGTNEVNSQLMFVQLMKKTMRGELLLTKAIQKAQADSMSGPTKPAEPETDLVKKLSKALDGVKSSVLLSGGVFIKNCFPSNLNQEEMKQRVFKHQIIIDHLSRSMISVYVMESALASLNKNRNERDERKVRWLFHQMLSDAERLPKEIIMMSSSGDEARTVLAMFRRLVKFELENKEELAGQIVQDLP